MASENQNVGFIGFVTRKDKDTGVNLLAKIVTPDKKRSLNKLVRVKVKANALDDYSCCVIDHAAMKKIIEESQDLEAISESFQFLYNGEHGTSISYIIEPIGDSSITQFLGDDGTLIGRPKYNPDGSADAVGNIRITVTKGSAEVTSGIRICIKGMSADEVLNSDKIYSATKGSLAEFLWDGIAVYGGSANDLYANQGYTHITSPLRFLNMSDIYVREISDTPIKCEWNIEYDEVADYIKGAAGKFNTEGLFSLPTSGASRICVDKDSADYGKIYQPTYKETCDNLIDNKFATKLTVSDSEAHNRRFYIGNTESGASYGRLRLVAKLTLGDAAPIEKVYMCGTTSQPMRTQEVCDFLKKIMKIKVNDTPYDFDNTPITISVPDMSNSASAAAARDQIISVFGNGHTKNLVKEQYDQLRLSADTLNNICPITDEKEPLIYAVPADGSADYVDLYSFTTKLFSPPTFISMDATDGSGNPIYDEKGRVISDDTRSITLPVGTSSSETGMYAADEILNSNADKASFAVRFHITVQKLSDGDRDGTELTFTKVFKFVRL